MATSSSVRLIRGDLTKKIGRKSLKVVQLRQRRDFTCEKSGIDTGYKAHLRLNLWKLLINSINTPPVLNEDLIEPIESQMRALRERLSRPKNQGDL